MFHSLIFGNHSRSAAMLLGVFCYLRAGGGWGGGTCHFIQIVAKGGGGGRTPPFLKLAENSVCFIGELFVASLSGCLSTQVIYLSINILLGTMHSRFPPGNQATTVLWESHVIRRSSSSPPSKAIVPMTDATGTSCHLGLGSGNCCQTHDAFT